MTSTLSTLNIVRQMRDAGFDNNYSLLVVAQRCDSVLTDLFSVKIRYSLSQLNAFREFITGEFLEILVGVQPVLLCNLPVLPAKRESIHRRAAFIRIARSMGVRKCLFLAGVTAGHTFDQMLIITDHINLLGDNPLIGKNRTEFGERFPDMTNAYEHKLRLNMIAAAKKHRKSAPEEGILVAVPPGKTLSTQEHRAVIALGSHYTGFVIVPEIIAARHASMQLGAALFEQRALENSNSKQILTDMLTQIAE